MPYIKEIQILQWLKKKDKLAAKHAMKVHQRLAFFSVSKDRTDEFYICQQCMCSLKRYL